MKKVYIKYNLYTLETDITVDGKELKTNSKLKEKITPDTRFQEWVEELPNILMEEYNDDSFEIIFHGTSLDYEDLKSVFSLAYGQGKIKYVKLDRESVKVYIKYNPYTLETYITVNGKELKNNSKLKEKIKPGSRFQEWVEELPNLLIEEYHYDSFKITFHGTSLDCEDLKSVVHLAYKQGKLDKDKDSIEYIKAEETKYKMERIDEVFKEILAGPFEELKSDEIKNAFNNAKNSDFEVCVVATMSSGKSTLINAMLRNKLMPAKQEACTAIITKIKDDKSNSNSWKAKVYNKEGKCIKEYNELNYKDMVELNEDKKVSVIEINGNIPFVDSKDISLILIDTPGPNNARNKDHGKVQSEFLKKSSKALVIYVMEGTFGNTDNNNLLDSVAKSMSVGGKQSKDRFIFIVNKMDARTKDDGNPGDTLKRVSDSLEIYGIKNPNLFPASALQALNIRLVENSLETDEDVRDEVEFTSKKLNRSENYHFEKYATVPLSIKENIQKQLEEAKENKDIYNQALIHTGIISIEAAINQYVQKYAKTAKIKNIVDTFIHNVDGIICFEKTKKNINDIITENEKEYKKICEQIENIERKIDDGKLAKNFENEINHKVNEVNEESKKSINKTKNKFQSIITKRIDINRDKELDIDEVEYEINKLKKFAEDLQPNFEKELDEIIEDNLIKTSKELLNKYKNKLASLTEDIKLGNDSIKIDPFKFTQGSLNSMNLSVDTLIKKKEIEDGEEWVKNTDKKWYKPWTWFQEKGYYRTKYKTVTYIKGDELAQEFFTPIQETIYNNGKDAIKYAENKSEFIKDDFNVKFRELDEVIKKKLNELKNTKSNKGDLEKTIQDLKWLEDIKKKIEDILKI